MPIIACVAASAVGFLIAMKAVGAKRAPMGYFLLAVTAGLLFGGLELAAWVWVLET